MHVNWNGGCIYNVNLYTKSVSLFSERTKKESMHINGNGGSIYNVSLYIHNILVKEYLQQATKERLCRLKSLIYLQ